MIGYIRFDTATVSTTVYGLQTFNFALPFLWGQIVTRFFSQLQWN